MHFKLKMGLIFTLLGGSLAGVGLGWFFYNLSFTMNATATNGIIREYNASVGENNDSMYSAIVEYRDSDGILSKAEEGIQSDSRPEIGKSVKVYLGKNGKAKVGTFQNLWLLPIVFCAIPSPFLIIGLVFILSYLGLRRRIALLQSSGERTRSTDFEIKQNLSLRINGNSPYYVEAAFKYGNKTYTARSEYLMEKREVRADSVAILFDPRNPRINYVTVEEPDVDTVELGSD